MNGICLQAQRTSISLWIPEELTYNWSINIRKIFESESLFMGSHCGSVVRAFITGANGPNSVLFKESFSSAIQQQTGKRLIKTGEDEHDVE